MTIERHCVTCVVCILCVLFSGASWAAPIATNTALPLSADEIIIREQFVMTRSSDSVGGTPRTVRISPYAGVRLPTGRDGKTGDGSVDVFGGVIATFASVQLVLDTQLRYDFNREADGFERGDSTRFDTSFQYRLAPGRVTKDTKAFVFGVLELSANHHDRNRFGGVTDPNSGGFQLYLTPGLQYATRRWIADLGVSVPIVNDLNGTALEPDYSILTSIRINF